MLRRVGISVATGLGGVLVQAVATKLWLAPLVIENRLTVHVSRFCNGRIP